MKEQQQNKRGEARKGKRTRTNRTGKDEEDRGKGGLGSHNFTLYVYS